MRTYKIGKKYDTLDIFTIKKGSKITFDTYDNDGNSFIISVVLDNDIDATQFIYDDYDTKRAKFTVKQIKKTKW